MADDSSRTRKMLHHGCGTTRPRGSCQKKKFSKIKIPTFYEAVDDNLEDILHSGTENVHLLSF